MKATTSGRAASLRAKPSDAEEDDTHDRPRLSRGSPPACVLRLRSCFDQQPTGLLPIDLGNLFAGQANLTFEGLGKPKEAATWGSYVLHEPWLRLPSTPG